MSEPDEPKLIENRFSAEYEERPIKKLRCSCLDAQYYGRGWEELKLHREEQDTSLPAWQKLLQAIDDAAKSNEIELSLGRTLDRAEWAQIVTLPPSIAKLRSVKRFVLYGSSLVRIPPEIGEMINLEKFEPYTSYRLHWFPYEILRCENLKDSTVSTRAIYGNHKYRPPFPRLPDFVPSAVPKECSVCRSELTKETLQQAWISLRVATDVLPLLVHACSEDCLKQLPSGAKNHVASFHFGGLTVPQPTTDYMNGMHSFDHRLADAQSATDTEQRRDRLLQLAKIAINANRPERLDELSESGLVLNQHVVLLNAAFQSRDLETAKRLIALGIDINAEVEGNSPLLAAASSGFLEGVEYVFANGVEPNESNCKAAIESVNSYIKHCREFRPSPMPKLIRNEVEQVLNLLNRLCKEASN